MRVFYLIQYVYKNGSMSFSRVLFSSLSKAQARVSDYLSSSSDVYACVNILEVYADID